MLGKELKYIRKKAGLTQKQIAEYLNVSQTTVVSMEAGTRRIKASEIEKLADLYWTDPYTLLNHTEDISVKHIRMSKEIL